MPALPDAQDDSTCKVRAPGELPSPPPNPATDETLVPMAGEGPTLPAGKKAPYDFLAPAQRPGELGRLGPYRVLKVLGAGGMGVVFQAEDPQLQRLIALKVMLPALAADPVARERFLREARAAAAIEHEHLVSIYQVGEDRGIPFLAMPCLQGQNLEDRLKSPEQLSLTEIFRIGREVAEGLAAAHQRGLIHRDIKPANIWLEKKEDTPEGADDSSFSRVKVLDFGLAHVAGEQTGLTQLGLVIGTPAYMAPEQARGESVDARTDLFSLGCVLYALCTGAGPFPGESIPAVLLAVAQDHPQPPLERNPEKIPAALSALVMRLLAKNPTDRPSSARAVIETLRSIEYNHPTAPGLPSKEGPASPPAGSSPPASSVRGQAPPGRHKGWPIRTFLTACVVAVAGAVLLMAVAPGAPRWLFGPRETKSTGANPVPLSDSKPVEVGIAYSSEKQTWLESATADFASTPEGKGIQIHLIPMGSLTSARAICQDQDETINVWAPSSTQYRDSFVQQWRLQHSTNPILQGEALSLTPLVFVMWEDRYQAFVRKYQTFTFATLQEALQEKDGWAGIAGHPDWGAFKFGHPDPSQANNGLTALLLMAYAYHKKTQGLTVKDVTDQGFLGWMKGIETNLAALPGATADMMADMGLKGPSTYDVLFLYESVAVDYLKGVQGRFGDLRVIYPEYNMWNENPYYILNVPWSSPQQRQAAHVFLRFLMSEPIQKKALVHGFRPGNLIVPIRGVADSPFVLYEKAGLKIDVPKMCEPPGVPVIHSLLESWEKVTGKPRDATDPLQFP